MTHLPLQAALRDYEGRAEELLAAWQSGDEAALRFFHRHHPRLRDGKIPWLARPLGEKELRALSFEADDARLAIARAYDFADWPALAAFAQAMALRGAAYEFESAVDAIVAGDEAGLSKLLRANPGLVHLRSARIAPFDPHVHAATLLHYVAANGVEGYRQKSPANSVAIARLLLEAGAEVDSLANLYGGECTTLSLLVSSSHPAAAGVQTPVAELLVDFGASLRPLGSGNWTSPVETALVFGFLDTAEALVRRGAPVLTVAAAAGLGLVDLTRELLPGGHRLRPSPRARFGCAVRPGRDGGALTGGR